MKLGENIERRECPPGNRCLEPTQSRYQPRAFPSAPDPGCFPLLPDYGRDIPESWIREIAPVVVGLLLADRSTGRNIRWCTDDYASRGEGFRFTDEIAANLVCDRISVIRPRVDKRVEEQKSRVSAKGEVFTPAWVCNAQNNLVDQSWLGLKTPIFTKERPAGWDPTDDDTLREAFRKAAAKQPDRKGQTYISLPRLEACCGEAPYLTTRYDAATGEIIPVSRRVGLLDRKLRVVSLLCRKPDAWVRAALSALQSIYAFEWQGDNVLIARENLLFATLEAFAVRFPDVSGLSLSVVESFASVLSWNVFQMDGVKFVVPLSCHDEVPPAPPPSLALDDMPPSSAAPLPCPGCKTGNHRLHNGIRPLVVDWTKSDFEPRAVPFHELFPSFESGKTSR